MWLSTLFYTIIGGDGVKIPVSIVVRDTRLAALKAALLTLVAVYMVLFDILLFHRDSSYEPPSGYVNSWAVPGRAATAADSRHCQNLKAYEWGEDHTAMERQLTGDFVAANLTCMPLSVTEHTLITDTSFNALTFEGILPPNQTRISQATLVTTPELVGVNMIHTYTTSWLRRGVTNPHTRILDASGVVRFEFSEGSAITGVTVGDFLRLAGVSLDDYNVAGYFRGGAVAEQARHRVTGVVLVVRMKYTNMRDWEMREAPRCDVTVEPLPIAWGFRGTQTEGGRTLYRTYASLQFVTSGTIGRYEFTNMVLALVQALVLLNFVNIIVNRAAAAILAAHYDATGAPFSRATSRRISSDASLPGSKPAGARGAWAEPAGAVAGAAAAERTAIGERVVSVRCALSYAPHVAGRCGLVWLPRYGGGAGKAAVTPTRGPTKATQRSGEERSRAPEKAGVPGPPSATPAGTQQADAVHHIRDDEMSGEEKDGM